MKSAILFRRILIFFVFALLSNALLAANTYRKSLWVWNTVDIVGITSEENRLINECISSAITDIYLFIQYNDELVTSKLPYQKFIEKCYCNNIRIWGMNGYRSYFSDQCGPSYYFSIISSMVTYNSNSTSKQRFVGFSGDNEFNQVDTWDCTIQAKVNVFHSGLTDAALSTTAGTGFWKSTQKQDRDSLLTDWVRQTDLAAKICHQAGLEYGVASMNWITGKSFTNAAMGNQTTPLYAKYKGVTKELYKHIIDYVDEYIIMSYHSNVVSKVVPMCKDVLDYTNTLHAATRPRVMSAVETHCGVGAYVSYCDTQNSTSKNDVAYGISQHFSYLGTNNASYSGVAIHDWKGGYQILAPASANTNAPGCVLGIENNETSTIDYLAPNPTNDKIVLQLNNTFGEVIVTVSGIDGEKLLTINSFSDGNLNQEIDLKTLNPGIYMLKTTSNLQENTFKIIKL